MKMKKNITHLYLIMLISLTLGSCLAQESPQAGDVANTDTAYQAATPTPNTSSDTSSDNAQEESEIPNESQAETQENTQNPTDSSVSPIKQTTITITDFPHQAGKQKTADGTIDQEAEKSQEESETPSSDQTDQSETDQTIPKQKGEVKTTESAQQESEDQEKAQETQIPTDQTPSEAPLRKTTVTVTNFAQQQAAQQAAAQSESNTAESAAPAQATQEQAPIDPAAGITILDNSQALTKEVPISSMADHPASEEELEGHQEADFMNTLQEDKLPEPTATIGPEKKIITSMADLPKTIEEDNDLIKELESTPEMSLTPTTTGRKQPLEKLIKIESKKASEKGMIYLGNYLEPWQGKDPNETMQMNFQNKELRNFLEFLGEQLDITFILDDDIEPTRAPGLEPIGGTKISFTSHIPLTLKQAWDIGLTFLEMAGFAAIPTTLPRTYHVTPSGTKDKPGANKAPLPTFIGTDPDMLPNSDIKIRYVYFIENADIATITKVIECMQSSSAGPIITFQQLRGILITDRAASIKSIMQVIKELDKVTMPETISIIHLRHADADRIANLYNNLIGKGKTDEAAFNPFNRQRKPTTTQYFTEATRVFAEKYTNSLIILGTRENIKRVENFILKELDRESDLPFSPLHIIQLKFINAGSLAEILNETIKRFNESTELNKAASAVGGVRDGNKFFRPSVKIVAEPAGNRLLINASYEEYLKLRETIEKLDIEQPQVAIKVLILNVDLSNTDTLGAQLRNKKNCCDGGGGVSGILGNNVNFQYTGLGNVITREAVAENATPVTGAERLLGNLLALANIPAGGVSPFGVGTTLVTLGRDMFGIFGLLNILETYTRVSVIANPFLVTTHKYRAEVRVGETRRTISALVEGANRQTNANTDLNADLVVKVTPQISYDNMVTLNIYVELSQFVESADPALPTRLIKKLSTEALLANKEVIALGGLIRDRIIENQSKVPILGDIPLLGWFFKSKTKALERNSLLILLSPEIIKPFEPEAALEYTFSKVDDAKETLYGMNNSTESRDPIHRWFFKDNKGKEPKAIDKFMSRQRRYLDASQRSIQSDRASTSSTMLPQSNKEAQQKTNSTAKRNDKKSILDMVENKNTNQAKVVPAA